MPAVALSRVGARVVESGPGGQELAASTWQRLEALPDPRSPRGRIYPLACLVAIAVCAFTAAGNDWFTAVGQWIRRASQADLPGCAFMRTGVRIGNHVVCRGRLAGRLWTRWPACPGGSRRRRTSVASRT